MARDYVEERNGGYYVAGTPISLESVVYQFKEGLSPETIQHDDLHLANLYAQGERLRVLDWGDSSISHPFASLVVTFRFLEETNKLTPTDPWFARLREAYLEPWGPGLADAFALAIRVGTFRARVRLGPAT